MRSGIVNKTVCRTYSINSLAKLSCLYKLANKFSSNFAASTNFQKFSFTTPREATFLRCCNSHKIVHEVWDEEKECSVTSWL